MPAKRRRRGPNPAVVVVIVVVLVLLALGGVAGAVFFFTVLSGPPALERLPGQWEADLPSGRILLNVHKDGRLDFTGITRSGIQETHWRKYEVLKDRSKSITLHLEDPAGANPPSDWKIEFLTDDQIRINFLTSGAEAVVYNRKK
jgi:hypothetical protein